MIPPRYAFVCWEEERSEGAAQPAALVPGLEEVLDRGEGVAAVEQSPIWRSRARCVSS